MELMHREEWWDSPTRQYPATHTRFYGPERGACAIWEAWEDSSAKLIPSTPAGRSQDTPTWPETIPFMPSRGLRQAGCRILAYWEPTTTVSRLGSTTPAK